MERFGLTSSSHIYVMNLYTNRIIQFDKYFKNLSKNYSPTYNYKGNKIAFASYNNYKSKNLIVYEIENDSIYILQENINRIKNIKWSENDKFIIYNCKIIKERINADLAIGILNLTTKEVNYITQKNWIYNVGMVKNNLLIYTGYNKDHENKDNKSSFIFSYDLQTKKKGMIYSYELPFLITDAQLSSPNIIYFIKIEFLSNGKIINDIFSLNIETKKLTQITNDDHIKSCLCILE
jgi:Tol biopolymer transport system component